MRQAEADRVLLNQQIAGRVAAAYWTAVASDGIEKLLEEDLHAVDEIVRYNKARVDAGAMRGASILFACRLSATAWCWRWKPPGGTWS